MYQQHMQACHDACQSSPDGTARMLRFVLATIQQQLETVPDIMADFETAGADSRFAFGSKKAGLQWLEAHASETYWDALAVADNDVELLKVFLRVPGLGLVKAGFAAQLFAGRVGCLDVHNIRLYNVREQVLRVNKNAKPETIHRRASEYAETCLRLGGPVSLWAHWCEYKAEVSPAGNWPEGGESVSMLHVEALHGTWWHTLPQFMLYEETPRYELHAHDEEPTDGQRQ